MFKKTIKIIVIAGLAAAATYGGYLLFRETIEVIRGPEVVPQAPVTQPQIKPVVLSDEEMFDYWIFRPISTSTEQISQIFYLTPQGRILRAQKEPDELIASQPVENLQSISPSRDGSLVLVKFGSVVNPQFSILNVVERSWQPLPLNVRAAALSPDSLQIALLISTNGKNDLVVQDLNPQPPKKGVPPKPSSRRILSLYEKGLDMTWVSSEKIFLTERPSSATPSSLWQIDLKNAEIISLVSEELGLIVRWQENEERGIKYSIIENVPRLQIVDTQGKLIDELSFSVLPLPQKCALSGKQLFCAVPEKNGNLREQANLLDAYLKQNFFFGDALYIYIYNEEGLSGGGSYSLFNRIPFENPPVDIKHLGAFSDKTLLFINRLDQKLYQLEL